MAIRASQAIAEALVRSNLAPMRASQVIAECLVRLGGGNLRASQVIASILIWTQTVPTPAIFPTLIGLGFSWVKRPVFYNANVRSGSGWNVRLAYAETPTWEWDLTYDVLTDPSSTSDLKKLLGFYIGMNADLIPFLFLDPDDHSVMAQAIGTTDGTTTTWTLPRTYGSGSVGVENIGYVNLGPAFNIYLGGVLQSGSAYSVLTTIPGNQQVRFTSAPTTGQAITGDYSYYYYAHFKDSTDDFEKFMNQFWTVKKLTLESLRG